MRTQPARSNRRNIATVLRVFSPHASSRRLPFCRGHTRRSSPKTGMRKFPHHEHFRPLGFAGQRRVRSDEDGKLVVVSARVSSWWWSVLASSELADSMGLRRVVGAVAAGGRLRSRDPQTSGLIGRAELWDEQCCLVDFIYRRLLLSRRRCALDRTKEARLASEHRELPLQECVPSSSQPAPSLISRLPTHRSLVTGRGPP